MAKPTRIAVDLTLLLDLAANDATAWKGIEAAKKAFATAEFIVSPATRQALAHAATATAYDPETRSLSFAALQRLKRTWDFHPAPIDTGGLAVCGENAKALVGAGLVGGHAWNSAHTIVEAACLECSLLLCHDPELLQIDHTELKKFLDEFDRGPLWITTPGEILRQMTPPKI